MTYASNLDEMGESGANASTSELYPVTQVTDLGSEFTAPSYPVPVVEHRKLELRFSWVR